MKCLEKVSKSMAGGGTGLGSVCDVGLNKLGGGDGSCLVCVPQKSVSATPPSFPRPSLPPPL